MKTKCDLRACKSNDAGFCKLEGNWNCPDISVSMIRNEINDMSGITEAMRGVPTEDEVRISKQKQIRELLEQVSELMDDSWKEDASFLLTYINILEEAYRSQSYTLKYYKQTNDQLLRANEEHYARLNAVIDQLRRELKARTTNT